MGVSRSLESRPPGSLDGRWRAETSVAVASVCRRQARKDVGWDVRAAARAGTSCSSTRPALRQQGQFRMSMEARRRHDYFDPGFGSRLWYSRPLWSGLCRAFGRVGWDPEYALVARWVVERTSGRNPSGRQSPVRTARRALGCPHPTSQAHKTLGPSQAGTR